MSRLFGRRCEVSVGQAGNFGTVIKDLRIVFKIETTLEKTPNNSTIDIYNLSAATRAVFEKKNAVVQLLAGYTGTAKNIFKGDIAKVVTKRSGTDVITSIEAQDGLLAYQTKELDAAFAPGAKVGSVLEKLIDSFGLTAGEIKGIDLNSQYVNGVSFSGKVKDHLDTLTGKQGDLDWFIHDGQLNILKRDSASAQLAVLLSPQTGLIGSPFKNTFVNQDIAKRKEGKENESGVTVKSLLNPDLIPGRLVRVQAEFLTGNFKIQKVDHTGDTFGGTWYSDVEGINL